MKACLIGLIICTLFGCANVTIEKADGTKLSYTRIGKTEIKSLSIVNGDDEVLLEGAKSDSDLIETAITSAIKAAK